MHCIPTNPHHFQFHFNDYPPIYTEVFQQIVPVMKYQTKEQEDGGAWQQALQRTRSAYTYRTAVRKRKRRYYLVDVQMRRCVQIM